ncbi:MAG: hypothetical protein AAB624_01105 [Patescibacteria group bacterium]
MKYVTWFFGLIAIVIAVVVGTILIRNIVNDNNSTTQKASTTKQVVSQIKEGTALRLLVEGPVIADEKHQSMQIDITSTSRTVTLFKTYNRVEFKKSTYTNNQKAFEAFAQALDRAGYTSVNSEVESTKYAGECALGRVYHLEVLQSSKVTQDLWTTSCSTTRSFGGNMATVLTLFKNQIPNYLEATTGSTVAR